MEFRQLSSTAININTCFDYDERRLACLLLFVAIVLITQPCTAVCNVYTRDSIIS
jgi:hypothetical protein